MTGKKTGGKIKNIYEYDVYDRITSKKVQDITESKKVYEERNTYTGNSTGLVTENKILGGNDGTADMTSTG